MEAIKFKALDLSLWFSFILTYDSLLRQITANFIDNILKCNSANFEIFVIRDFL